MSDEAGGTGQELTCSMQKEGLASGWRSVSRAELLIRALHSTAQHVEIVPGERERAKKR